MPWASTPFSGAQASRCGVWLWNLALVPVAVTFRLVAASAPSIVTSMTPPRGIVWEAISTMLRISLTLFLGSRARVALHASLILSSPIRPRATPSASPVSMEAPADPAAPKARRQNCRRAEATPVDFLMRSIAKPRMSGSFSDSSTSRPLAMAPTGEMTSWHTREQSRAARSRGSRVKAVIVAIPCCAPPCFPLPSGADAASIALGASPRADLAGS